MQASLHLVATCWRHNHYTICTNLDHFCPLVFIHLQNPGLPVLGLHLAVAKQLSFNVIVFIRVLILIMASSLVKSMTVVRDTSTASTSFSASDAIHSPLNSSTSFLYLHRCSRFKHLLNLLPVPYSEPCSSVSVVQNNFQGYHEDLEDCNYGNHNSCYY